jgi:hypothetical protein
VVSAAVRLALALGLPVLREKERHLAVHHREVSFRCRRAAVSRLGWCSFVGKPPLDPGTDVVADREARVAPEVGGEAVEEDEPEGDGEEDEQKLHLTMLRSGSAIAGSARITA